MDDVMAKLIKHGHSREQILQYSYRKFISFYYRAIQTELEEDIKRIHSKTFETKEAVNAANKQLKAIKRRIEDLDIELYILDNQLLHHEAKAYKMRQQHNRLEEEMLPLTKQPSSKKLNRR